MHGMALKGDPSINERRKPRLCLKCQASFGSEWAGERICPRCKATDAWRSGFHAQIHPMSRASKRSS
jgi:hypothetical protein